MGEMEDTMDLLGVVLPTLLGVAMVMATVVIVFWIGSGKKRSYEEAKAQASRKAEEALKEREQTSPKAKKPRKNFRKKKVEEPHDEVPRRGILKTTPPAAPQVETSPERQPPNKVEFKLDTPVKEGSANRHANPPTPYPNKDASLVAARTAATAVKTPQPIFEEEEEESEPAKPTDSNKSEVAAKKKQDTVAPKPSQATQKPSQKPPQPHGGQAEPAERVAMPKEAEIKRKPASSSQKRPKMGKSKLVIGSGMEIRDGLPAARIVDIVSASSLTDEEIEPLIELLLEKSNANLEWEAPNLKAESNKSLKKLNQELQSKLEEAQQTAVSHSNKIRELRKEILAEKNKQQSAENTYQSKFNHQAKDLAILRARSLGLEEEMKRMKAVLDAQHLQKLREENSLLSTQLAQLQQQQAAMTTQLQKSRASETPAGVMEKVAEQETLLELRMREIEQLTANSQRLQAQLQSMTDVCKERDMLKQEVDKLESSHTQLAAEAQQASAVSEGSMAHIGALQDDLQTVRTEAAQEKAELQSQHQGEVQELRKELAEVESLRECAARLEERNKELTVEADKGSKMEEQVKSLTLQLEAEQASKNDLKEELECQTKAMSNGLVAVQGLSNGPDNEQPPTLDEREVEEVAILEKKLEDLKTKNDELKESLWQAKRDAGTAETAWDEKLKQVREKMEQSVSSAKVEAIQESYADHRTLLRQLLPEVSVKDCDDGKQEQWLEEFESKAQEILGSRKEENTSLEQKIRVLEKQNEESTGETLQFRHTLEKTMDILAKLQTKVDSSNLEHQQELLEKETALQTECGSSRRLQGELSKEKAVVGQVREELGKEKAVVGQVREELGKEKAVVGQVREELGKEKALVSQVREELDQVKERLDHEKALVGQVREELRQEREEAARMQEGRAQGGQGEEGQGEEVAKLEERLQQLEQSRTSLEKEVAELEGELKGKEEAHEVLEHRLAAECKLKEDAFKKSDELEVAGKVLAERLETMKQSNRELNAHLSSLVVQSPTDSEV